VTRHLFILAPPYSGSTLLYRLVATSPAVSALPGEGQHIESVQALLARDAWAEDREIPWGFIRAAWERHWDLSKPVLLEKSPPHMMRAAELQEAFAPASFLILVRDPYCLAEGIVRRWDWDARAAGEFTVRLLRRQRQNLALLERRLLLRYEDMAADPAACARSIVDSLPELERIDPERKFRVHSIDGLRRRRIVDLNELKLRSLSVAQFEELTQVFEPDAELLAAFGYAPRETPADHARRHAWTRLRLGITAPYRMALTRAVDAWRIARFHVGRAARR